MAAWAMGADAFVYPEETGLSIGGANFNPYVMLEVHYNNPELHQGIIDSSGIRFVLTKSLRKYDAGVIELGLEYTDKMAIPAGQVKKTDWLVFRKNMENNKIPEFEASDLQI